MIEIFLVNFLPFIFLGCTLYISYVAISFVAVLLSKLVNK
jgi:hypothetical protein